MKINKCDEYSKLSIMFQALRRIRSPLKTKLVKINFNAIRQINVKREQHINKTSRHCTSRFPFITFPSNDIGNSPKSFASDKKGFTTV